MSVNNTTTHTGFFRSIGNWFNRNGETVGKSMQLAGNTAMGVGVMGMMFKAMNAKSCHCNNGSIWGGGFGGCSNAWPMMGGMDMYGSCGMFGGMSMLNNMGGGMTNPYLTMMGMQGASNFGLASGINSRANLYSNPMYQTFYNQSYNKYSSLYANNPALNTTKTVDPDAEVDYTAKGGDVAQLTTAELAATDDGESLNTAFSKGKKFRYAADGATTTVQAEGLAKYAKSYIAYVDKEVGDGDGLISEDEFVEHEGTGETAARRAFKQFDLNNDGNLDWKEYSALLRTYDADHDGEITSAEYKSANTSSASGISKALQNDDENTDMFRRSLNRSYDKLYGE